MERKLIILLLMLAPYARAGAQTEAKTGVHAGMVRAQATFALGVATATAETRYYVYGEFEGMMSDHIGLDGSVWVQAGANAPFLSRPDIYHNFPLLVHGLFAGPNYHFLPDRRFDIFLGLHPGLLLSSLPHPNDDGDAIVRQNALAPAGSAVTGLACYGSFFHIFAQARGVLGRHITRQFDVSLNDLRLSFGLGFNFN